VEPENVNSDVGEISPHIQLLFTKMMSTAPWSTDKKNMRMTGYMLAEKLQNFTSYTFMFING